MLISVFLVYAVGFECSLDALDGSLCDFILFAQFGDLASQYHALVSQFRRCILSAHLLNNFRPLCGKAFYLPGQALAVVYNCLQRGKLVVVDKGVFCKDFLSVFPDALQFRAVDTRLLFLGQDTQLIAVVQIQAVHLGFPKEYLEENLEDASIFRRTIPFRRVLPGRVFQLIQPWSVQQVVPAQSVIYGCKIVFFSQPIKPHGSTTIPRPDGCIFSVWITAENIPLPIQRPVEIFRSAGILTGLVDGLPHPGISCRFL